jgi:hypothetical protein
VLGGHSIGHSKQEMCMYSYMCPIPNRFRTFSLYNSKIVHKKEILHTVSIKQKKNSVVLVRKRTTPTERPPFVGEVSANFSG